jgi:hypothetical protein
MKHSVTCPGVRFDPLGEKTLSFAKSFGYTKSAKEKLIEQGAMSAF